MRPLPDRFHVGLDMERRGGLAESLVRDQRAEERHDTVAGVPFTGTAQAARDA